MANARMRVAVGIFALASLVLLAAVASAKNKPRKVEVDVSADTQAEGYEAWRAIDGDPKTLWHTNWLNCRPAYPHELTIDLRQEFEVAGFRYTPREGLANGALGKYECYVAADKKALGKPVAQGEFPRTAAATTIDFPQPVKGRYFVLKALSELNGQPHASVAELALLIDGVQLAPAKKSLASGPAGEVLVKAREHAAGDPTLLELADQHEVLLSDLRQRAHFANVASQTFRASALVTAADRDPLDIVVRRTRALYDDLTCATGSASAERGKLAALRPQLERLESAAKGPLDDGDARYRLYVEACKLRRQIAFTNPLLNFDKLLFVKRHRSTYDHMCDQYYGATIRPGGGIFVLEKPFGDKPQERDLLRDALVAAGRLAGTKLTGSFVTPSLSYDAQELIFAYVECTGPTRHEHHVDPARGHWAPGRSYHLFKCKLDGSELTQLTDGGWNDFAPCHLPNGRVALISERRGGYLRCGRVCPTYTLYDMAADGSEIRPLSVHETNEWHPSVTHDGRIIYTRWDYVDRFGCTAHHPWITTLDGRDSRAVHGNFAPRRSRPDMELDVRAIPGSHRYSATAAPHHGQAYGSLVLIDPWVEDDDAMAPLRRITPDVGFPESQGGAEVYGTPWPLSEDYYLCVYDAGRAMKSRGRSDNYGIYLVDSFGNKELIYRDSQIGCLSPMPLRPREKPPVGPELELANVERLAGTRQAVSVHGRRAEGTMACVNVYESLKPWPAGTKIKQLRIIQLLPMTVPSGGPPHEIGLREASSGDSVTLARNVLGTVPVEEDGSAHFYVPAQKEVLFQALDERGLAVQSMRSAAYVQPGEKLVCQGCHERKHQAPKPSASPPLAMRREASRPVPDVDGTHPFSYPRLVQPVLDKHCVQCHADPQHKDKAPNLARAPIEKRFFASYNSLTRKYGFYNYGSPVRTTPGQFGARASRLYKLLSDGHYDVKLNDEELHRIAVWLDCCSIFYGVYEKEGGEAQLRGEIVQPTLE